MSGLDRTAIPGNLLDRVEDIERRLDDLVGFAAMATIDPESGEGEITYVEILQELEVAEGPDIVVTGTSPDLTIGRAGDSILLFDSGGAVLREYAFTSAGLTVGLAAMAAGDVLEMSAGTITGGPWTVAADTTLRGLGYGSVLVGTITNNGTVEHLRCTNVVQNAGARLQHVYLYPTSGIGIDQRADAIIMYCTVFMQTGTDWGIYITDGWLLYTNVFPALYTSGLYCNGNDVEIAVCSFGGVGPGDRGAQIENALVVSGCMFRGFGTDGLYHTTGTATLVNCVAVHDVGAGYGINLAAGGMTFIGCAWDTINGQANISYGLGDRGAYSVEDHHGSDIELAALTRHLPLPGAALNRPVSDGEKWINQIGIALAELLGGAQGNIIRREAAAYVTYVAKTARQFLVGDGTDVVSRAIETADLPSAGLTKVNDTNVTLALGGNPATALLAAASLTLGWTGQLAPGRGGTGVDNAGTFTNATNSEITGGGTVALGGHTLTVPEPLIAAGRNVANTFTEVVRSSKGLATVQDVTNVDDPPTDAQLDGIFGSPATLGRGFIATLDDNDDDTDVYVVWTSDASWYYTKGTKAL